MTPLFLASAISDSIFVSIQSLVPSGTLTLVDAAARALLVAGIVGAGLRLTAARHVPAQKAAWGLVLGGALLMPIMAPWANSAAWVPAGATWVLPTHTWAKFVVSRASALTPVKETIRTADALPSIHAVEHVPVAATAASIEPTEAAASGASQADRFPAPTISYSESGGADFATRTLPTGYTLPIPDLVWIVYGAVCLGLLLRLGYGLGGAIGLWQSAEPVKLDPHVSGGLRLRSSGKITSPVTIGSAVVLPADYEEWDTQKLRIVLAHERSHVRQGDFYLQALAGLYTALFWFSPLGWWLKRKLSDLSETISDRAGLEEAPSHASYARILLEFAALPRRAQVGVAMARTGGIAQRIERLLNEHSFRQAFAGGRRRLLAALLLVPMALFAATALIRVQAAQTLQHPVSAQGPVIVQSHPESTPETAQQATPAPAAEDQPPPPQDGDQDQAPATPSSPAAASTPASAAAPPAPPSSDEDQVDQDQTVTTNTRCNSRASNRSFTRMSSRNGYSYSYSDNGDSYALITGGDKNHMSFSGDWYESRRAEIDKARAMAHGGDFLWFTHDGKSYVVDDPHTIAFIQSLYKPMEELGQKQQELGRQQQELGRQQQELGRRQRLASIPAPDVSREMAQLNAAISKLQAQKNGTITIEELSEVQGKIGELQGKLGGLYGEIGTKQGELGREQGHLGDLQGKLGEQQGRLGEEQGRIAREADGKVHSIIGQSLKDGRAKAVE